MEAIVFSFPPSFPLKSGKFIVSKCLFSFRCFWESKANTVQYYVTGIYEAFLKYWFLTPCEPFCLSNTGNCHPSGFFSEAALTCIRKIFFDLTVVPNLHVVPCIYYQYSTETVSQCKIHCITFFSSISLFFSSGDILLAPQGWCHLIYIPIRRGLCWKYLTVGWMRSRVQASLPLME